MSIDCYNSADYERTGSKDVFCCWFIISKSDPNIAFIVSCFQSRYGENYLGSFNCEFRVTNITSRNSGYKWKTCSIFVNSSEEFFDSEMSYYHADFPRVLASSGQFMSTDEEIANRFNNGDFRIAKLEDEIISRALDFEYAEIMVGGASNLRLFSANSD